jgi:hypothetical protein
MEMSVMKRLLSVLVGAVCATAVAQAQTTTLVDTTLFVPTYLLGTADFTVAGPSVFVEGASVSNSEVQGIGFLTYNGNILDTFALTNGSVKSVLFNTFTLTNPGSYRFLFDFANSNSSVGHLAGVEATVTPVSMVAPEIDPASAAAAGTLLIGGLAVLAGRRRNPAARAGAAHA